MLDNVKWGKP